MLKNLEDLKQEKQVVENIIKLRRDRHAEQMEELKSDYADKTWQATGSVVMTDTYIKELDEKFEKGLTEEFGQQLESIDTKMQMEADNLKLQIAKEIEEKEKLVEDKKVELENAQNEINHQVMMQYFSKEGLSEQPIDRTHVEELKIEIEKLSTELEGLGKQKEEIYARLEELGLNKEQKEKQNEEKTVEKSEQEEELPKPEEEKEELPEIEEEFPMPEEYKEQPIVISGEENVVEETVAEKTEPEQPKTTVSAAQSFVNRINRNIYSRSELKQIRIDINREGSKFEISRESGKPETERRPLFDKIGLDKVKGSGDKYVLRELALAVEKGYLSIEEAKEQINLYQEIISNPNEDLKKQMKLDLHYNLKGLRKADISKEEIKEIENNAKQAKDLGIAEVEAPWYTKAKWFAKDAYKNVKPWAQKRLPKGKEAEQLPEGKVESKKEEQAKKPGELTAEEKVAQQEVAKEIAETFKENEQTTAPEQAKSEPTNEGNGR